MGCVSIRPIAYGGLTSHAKNDPKTGELFFISWGPRPPFLHVGVAAPTVALPVIRPSTCQAPPAASPRPADCC